LQAYGDGTSAPGTVKLTDRINTVIEGAHGHPRPQASLLTTDTEGRINATIITTERDLGHGTAVIAELFTDPPTAEGPEQLLSNALQALHDTCHKSVAVTVDSANAAVLAIYLFRDFRRLTGPAEDNQPARLPNSPTPAAPFAGLRRTGVPASAHCSGTSVDQCQPGRDPRPFVQ
jgi:hypothetical protein